MGQGKIKKITVQDIKSGSLTKNNILEKIETILKEQESLSPEEKLEEESKRQSLMGSIVIPTIWAEATEAAKSLAMYMPNNLKNMGFESPIYNELPSNKEPEHLKKFNSNMNRFNRELDREKAEKAKTEQDRHNQLITALGQNNNQTMKNEVEILKSQVEKMKLDNEKILLENKQLKQLNGDQQSSALLLISVLFKLYQSEKTRAYTQEKVLSDIAEENADIRGLSYSTTSKIISEANKIYKQLKNKV